ncbi:MAG: phosphate acyltransferase, partial [Gammaproteobacteria bacterium]
MLPIAIDVMSGDHEPREYIAGALRALSDDPQLRAQLVGEPQLIIAALAPLPASVRERAIVVAASQVVAMEDKPR